MSIMPMKGQPTMLETQICRVGGKSSAACKNKENVAFLLKLGIAIIFDVVDFFLGQVPVVGTAVDVVGTGLGLVLWGPIGLAQAWEVVAVGPGNTIDAFIPTLTLAGIMLRLSGRKGGI